MRPANPEISAWLAVERAKQICKIGSTDFHRLEGEREREGKLETQLESIFFLVKFSFAFKSPLTPVFVNRNSL